MMKKKASESWISSVPFQTEICANYCSKDKNEGDQGEEFDLLLPSPLICSGFDFNLKEHLKQIPMKDKEIQPD